MSARRSIGFHATAGLALLLGPALAPAWAQQADVVLSPRHYDLAIALDVEAETLQGHARIVLVNPADRPVETVSLLLYRLMRVDSARDDRGRPLRLTQAVVAFDDFAKLQVNRILLRLPAPLPPGGETAVRIAWSGHLLGYAETGMGYVQDRITREFTILRDDAWAYPRPGLPSIAALRGAPQPSFGYAARITVPAELTVANGGRLVAREEKEGGRVTYAYASAVPSWRMDFAVARYALRTEGPIRIFHFEGDSAGAAGVARAARTALDLFVAWFGPLRGSRALTFIEIPDGFGSQADAATIIQTRPAFRDSTRHREVTHEISHLWHPPALDRPSPRWEEGLASFLESVVAEETTGSPVVDADAEARLDRLRQGLADRPRWREVPLRDYGRAGLTDLSYRVGAAMFDLVVRVAGPQDFRRIVREYHRRFGEARGTTEDFVRLARDLARADLGPLFQDWVFTTRWADRVLATGSVEQLAGIYRR